MFFHIFEMSAILIFVTVCAASVAGFGIPKSEPQSQPVTETCLQCICQASSGCKQGTGCANDVCGLFGITRPYWIDAGTPTIDGGAVTALCDYPDCASDPDCANCANDPHCAARTVQAYMTRFPQDCNGDGEVNCLDYMAIHMKGGYGCQGDLPHKYKNTFYQCMSAYDPQLQQPC